MLTYGLLMIPNYNFNILYLIRLGQSSSLIFFVLLLLYSCKQIKPQEISIVWKDSQAIGITVPRKILTTAPLDSLHQLLKVCLESQKQIAILGEHRVIGDEILFQPAIAFTRGLNYEIIFRDRQIAKIKIPSVNAANAPALLAIYPSADTLPENLLKIYLQFSHPMREGESQNHIALLNNQGDTIYDVFLDLQPELWNQERTALTIWLDPGRIKRDLIPNQLLGNPLKKGEQYTFAVSSKWKDFKGIPLAQTYHRQFIVGSRDSVSPDPDRWVLDKPGARTNNPLVINFGEPLDYFLLQETIQITDENGNRIKGSIIVRNEEKLVTFIPDVPWPIGSYQLRVASYLEDLSGNNLIKLFDRDITVIQSQADKKIFQRNFVINP